MLAFLLALASYTAHTGEIPGMSVLTPDIKQGESAIIRFLSKPTEILLNNTPLSPFPYANEWRVILPYSLTAPTGEQVVKASFSPLSIEGKFFVASATPNIIQLPVPPKLGQTPTQLVQNLKSTNSSIRKTTEKVTDVIYFTKPFVYPVNTTAPVSSPFNEIRQTGDERITHLGVDFDLPTNTPVHAINDGIVQQTYVDPIYGNSVILDHGQGIFSLYLHLEKILTQTGAVIQQNELVGLVGETGLASAPHLHLSIKIKSTSVDPLQFINTFQ